MANQSGLLASLDVRDLAIIQTANGRVLFVANNSGLLQAFNIREPDINHQNE